MEDPLRRAPITLDIDDDETWLSINLFAKKQEMRKNVKKYTTSRWLAVTLCQGVYFEGNVCV